MRLVDAALPRFARHETFHPRYGWFRKAYAQVLANPRAFFRRRRASSDRGGKEHGPSNSILGPGRQTRCTEDPDAENRRAPDLMTTALGDALFGAGGWDEYMEDPGTLWLLHWLLLAPPCHLPIWWLAFNEFHAVEFTEDDLHAAVNTQLDLAAEWRKPHPSSIKKDVGALLRTYAPQDRRGRVADRRYSRLPAPRTQPDQSVHRSGAIPVRRGNEGHAAFGDPDILHLGLPQPP